MMATGVDNLVTTSSTSLLASSSVANSKTVTGANTIQEGSVYSSRDNPLFASGHRSAAVTTKVPDIPSLPSVLMVPPVSYSRSTSTFTGTSANSTNVISTCSGE